MSQDEHDKRVAEVQQLLLTVRRDATVQRTIAERWDITHRQARNWIRKAYAKWKADAAELGDATEAKIARRNKARDTYETVIAIALNRTEVVKDDDGTVRMDEREKLADGRPNPRYKLPIERPKPDLVRVVTAMLGIRHLDGLDEPTKVELAIPSLEDRLPEVGALPEKVQELLSALSGNELRKMAGSLFDADNLKAN